MDAEYMEDIAKKSQIAQSAHKGASKPKWPMTGKNGPVMVWPDLPIIRFLNGQSLNFEVGRWGGHLCLEAGAHEI